MQFLQTKAWCMELNTKLKQICDKYFGQLGHADFYKKHYLVWC